MPTNADEQLLISGLAKVAQFFRESGYIDFIEEKDGKLRYRTNDETPTEIHDFLDAVTGLRKFLYG